VTAAVLEGRVDVGTCYKDRHPELENRKVNQAEGSPHRAVVHMQGLEYTHWYLHDRASIFSSRKERLRIQFLVEIGEKLIVAFFCSCSRQRNSNKESIIRIAVNTETFQAALEFSKKF
jgi:hypothetical protein